MLGERKHELGTDPAESRQGGGRVFMALEIGNDQLGMKTGSVKLSLVDLLEIKSRWSRRIRRAIMLIITCFFVSVVSNNNDRSGAPI